MSDPAEPVHGSALRGFAFTASVPSGWTGTFGQAALTLAPGASASMRLTVTSPSATDKSIRSIAFKRRKGHTDPDNKNGLSSGGTMPLYHHSLNQKICSIKLDTDNRPVALIGRIKVCVTSGRGAAPPPYSGFVTDYTPFDRGHIMALELGGPDISQNIVPQYAQWQETGTWRKMETALAVATN
ncbi:MAG: DNA/RNA non-specific endonuclease, partial [Burkholderiales bacterium]